MITQASAGLANVTALVYLAAFGLDEGESCASVQQPFSPSLLASTSYPTGYDAPGAPQGPDLYIAKERFRETFCADVPVDIVEVMFATQRPLSLAALTENAIAAGWKAKPSWYLVSEHDNAIRPTPSDSWPNAWAPRPSPSPVLTPPSSPNRWPSPVSSADARRRGVHRMSLADHLPPIRRPDRILEVTDIGEPHQPGLGQLQVQISAFPIHPGDLLAISASSALAGQQIAGIEATGVVTEVGAGVTGFSPGTRVSFFPHQGSSREVVNVDAAIAVTRT